MSWVKIVTLGVVIWGLSLFRPEVNSILAGVSELAGWAMGAGLAATRDRHSRPTRPISTS